MCAKKPSRKLNRAWEELLKNNHLTNGTVTTDDGGKFKVHLELLASVSPFFKHMVTTLSETPVKDVCVPSIDREAMQIILNYAYSGKLALPSSQAENLILSAELLGLPRVRNLCAAYLVSKLNDSNCVNTYKFAISIRSRRLLRECKRFLLTNFERIYAKSTIFRSLSGEDLEMLLKSDELNVSNEESVFWAIISWIDEDPEHRKQHLPQLLACIRFGFCSVSFYHRSVITHPYVNENLDCQTVLYQASTLFLEMNGTTSEQLPIDIHHPLVRPRIPNEIIFVIGGWCNGSASNVIETYDVRAKRWFPSIYTDTMPRAYHGLTALNGLIYMVGGFDGHLCFNSLRCYDPEAHTWSEKACMYVARCYVSVATVGNSIYALGGYDGHSRVNSGERYDPSTNQWYLIASMHHIRSDASAASFNGKIYIVGGFSGMHVLNSAEVYDPSVDLWTLIPDMSTPRSGVSITAYADRIYVLGGFNGTNRLNTVEYYDTLSRQWHEVPAMAMPRSNFASVVLEGKIYVIGGFNGATTVPNVESFCSVTNSWEVVPEMNLNRSALAACVVKGLPNNHEYSFLGSAALLAD